MAFTHGSKMNSHDWIQTMQCAGEYILAGLFDGRKMDAVSALLKACNGLLTMTSAKDTDNRDQLDRLKLRTVEALVKCESVLPCTELCIVFHALIHVPDAMHRWNSCRNFWSFFGERMMGYFIRFVHNRDLACENICTAYLRMRYLLDRKPGSIAALLDRLSAANIPLPKTSMLRKADEIRGRRPGFPGEHLVVTVPSQRNIRHLKGGTPAMDAVLRDIKDAISVAIRDIRSRNSRSRLAGERQLWHMATATQVWQMINGIIAHLIYILRI
jgi:hypothetical protein